MVLSGAIIVRVCMLQDVVHLMSPQCQVSGNAMLATPGAIVHRS